MAAKAAADTNLSDQSVNESAPVETTSKPPLVQSISRSSVTFFSGESASQVANQKFLALKNAALQQQHPENEKEEVKENGKKDVDGDKDNEKKIVGAVLNHCVSGKFDLALNYVINDPFNILVLLELIDSSSSETQLDILTLLQSLLRQSIKNYQACTKVGLISKLLIRIPKYEDDSVADKAIDLVGDLATYSITVRELKCFFSALQRTEDRKWPPHALKLLQILKKMPEKHGPDVYFNFSGKRGGVITVPPIARWPHQPGFTFVTWLQLDAAHLSPAEQSNRPHLYCFVNSRGLGYSAHFSGPMLVVEVWGKNGKKQTLLVKSKFEPQIWYHICISHTYNRFKSSEVKIFVNGQMVTSGDATMPVNKEPTDKCFIGGSHLNDNQHIFKGQMSAVYLFAEPLGYNTVIALYRLGPGYKGQFKFINELESTIADTDKKLIYDGKLSQNLLFTYNPKAVDGEMCLESSPNENQSCFYHSPHALMMDGVQAVVTHSLQAAMHSLGGIQMLFPLFTQLDCPLEEGEGPHPKICSILLALIYDLLRGSSVCQQQMIQSQGFMIIGHMLQKSSPIHLTEETVDILLGLARFFMATESAHGLLGGLLDHVLLEPSLWIKTPLSLQSNLLSLFATGYVGGLDYAGYIRKEVGVARLILILRKYYSVSSRQNATTVEEIISLRAFVLLLIKQMIIKDHGITGDELKSILVYLAVEEEEENHLDVIQLLLSVMCEKPASIIPCFDQMEGFQVFFKLLVANNEQIRVCSLKILCAYMQQLTVKRKLELVDQYGFISKLGEKLAIFDMTMVTYNALFEFLTARPTKIISEKRHASPDASYIMYHPTVLPIIVSLLLNGRTNDGREERIHDLTMVFLSDLTILLNSNNDNKRLLLQLMCWQDWLFSLSYFDSDSKESKISDTVFSIIKMLLSYAIQHEKEGWRVWVDTLSILHSKISLHNDEENLLVDPPHAIYDEESETYVDQETGEVVTNQSKPTTTDPPSTTLSPKSVSSNKSSPSIESDTRKMFFEKLLKSNDTSVISGQLDSMRRAQSVDNLNVDKDTEETPDDRPRSASPNLISSVQEAEMKVDESSEKPENVEGPPREGGDVEETESYVTDENTEESKSEIDSVDIKSSPSKKVSTDSKLTNYAKDNLNISIPPVDTNASLDQNGSVPESPASSEKSKCRPFLDIPEFNWSPAHQRLLTELLFSIEKDIQVWKTHTRKSVTDFVSLRENTMYIMNLCHMVSILSDSLIYCSGGLLPLMASATSSNFANDVLEACGGMELDSAFSFLNRVLNIIDVIAFASSINFASVETHRNMSAGGVLRQCIRLVFSGAARNRVVCRQRERPSKSGHLHPKTLKETQEAIKTLIASTKPATEEVSVQNIPGHMTTITDPEKLLQDSDINRLRALVYRESEDSRQSQYVALVVIYFVAVLMVARYRDVLEHDLSEDRVPRRKSTADMEPEDPTNPTSPKKRSATMSNVKPLNLDERLEIIFNTSANLLREVLFDFSHYLSKVLVGSRNQDLISEGLGSLKSEDSTVELVMLLCSQEWQNALQRMAGTAFMDLVDEGRLLSHSTRERIVITGSEARDIMTERDNFENLKHAQFETTCTKTVINCIEQYRTYDHFFKAKKKRNNASATQSIEKIFDVLTSEFGAWSIPEVRLQPQFYKLDRWEDMQRRRYRTIKNQFGTSHPEATLRPGSAEEIPPDKPPPLRYHLYMKDGPATEVVSESEDEGGELDTTLEEKQLIYQQQQQSSILLTADAYVVSPGATIPGTLAITNDSLYFTADEESDEVKNLDPQIHLYNDCLNIKCSFVNIVALYSRRYLLQNKAVELFLANRRSFMFAFSSHEVVKKVVQLLPSVGVGPEYGLPITRSTSLASPRALFMKSNMTHRWQNKEISNFEYLIFLNTIVGRTYNDLSQYFVFPWVLQDYESKELDLKNPDVYRNLSKPIGALNPFRLGQFIERYNSWDDNDGIPAFHYGTHYSTGGFVLNWMVRMEPFASLFLSLQGGKFDHPLRTFSSIKRAWDNCQRDTSDVKELIPELYYLPDMLRNNNKFVWGEGEDGKQINDVELPAWADSPEQFIQLHREALESDYVSNNLHKWIDLIFGYKQKGKEAEHSANVFYHLTYEGSVNIDAITDDITKEALIQQIKSFGQTPHQILTTPHPSRMLNKEENPEPHKSIFLSFIVTPEVPVTHVTAYTGKKSNMPAIITISCNQMFSVNKWINFGGSITSFHSLKNVQIEQDPSLETNQGRMRRQLGEPLHESVTVTSSCFAVTSNNKFIFTCGYWDKSFKCFSTESGKLAQCVFGHWDVVTCLAYSDDDLTMSNAIIVSGSLDATVLVWIWDQKGHKVMGPADHTGNGSTPIAICTGHELPITCVDVNTSVGIIASGSVEGVCLVHSLSGELLRSLKGPSICIHPRLINISNVGRVLVNYSNETGYMAMFTSNGKLMSHVKLTEQNLAVVFSSDGCFFVTGGFNRCFQVWRSFDMTLLSVFPPCDGSIRSLALTPDQKCMVAGLSTGSIIAMAMDFSIWPRVYSSPKPTQQTQEETASLHEEEKDEGVVSTPQKQQDEPTFVRNTSPTTQLVDKVPDDDVNADSENENTSSKDDEVTTEKETTAIVNGVPTEDDAAESDDVTKEEVVAEKKTSSLIHPVPTNDEEEEGEIPKTLLETARQGSSDSSLA